MKSGNPSANSVNVRLCIMMFLQFFVWGAWYTMVGQYLARIGLGGAIGWVYFVGPIAAITSPLFLGIVADRYFSSERVLAVLMAFAGIFMLFVPSVAESCAAEWNAQLAEWEAQGIDAKDQIGPGILGIFPPLIGAHLPLLGILFLHMLCYMPTLGLTNTIAFQNITNQEKQFPVIRVFGTIGWIVAGFILGTMLHFDETPRTLQVAGWACIGYAVFALFLPHTAPPMKGKKASVKELFGLDAIGLMKEPAYAIFIVCSLLLCIPLAAYYSQAQVFINNVGFRSAGGIMTWGQISEIVFMLLIPFFFIRLGVKWMLAVGMLAWVLRYVLFSVGAPDGVIWMVFIGILLHGICYDFFFVTGQIYTDKKASANIRGQAQGFLVPVTQGIGLGVGALIMGRIVTDNAAPNQADLVTQAEALRESSKSLAESDPAASEAAWDQASSLLLQSEDWQTVWAYPAGFALVILIIFVVFFRDKKVDSSIS